MDSVVTKPITRTATRTPERGAASPSPDRPAPAPEQHQDRVDQLRAELEDLRGRVAIVAMAPRPASEIEAVIPRVIGELRSRVDVDLTSWTAGVDERDAADWLVAAATANKGAGTVGLLACVVPDMLADYLKRELHAGYAQLPPAVGAKVQRAELAKLADEKRALERQLVDELWQLDQGGSPSWRGDEDVVAVLGLSPAEGA